MYLVELMQQRHKNKANLQKLETYLKSNKPIYVDLSIRKFSTPNIKEHKNKWYCQKWGPQKRDSR